MRKYRSWEYPWVSTRRNTTLLVFAPQWAVFSQASRTRCLEVSDGDRQNAIERVVPNAIASLTTSTGAESAGMHSHCSIVRAISPTQPSHA